MKCRELIMISKEDLNNMINYAIEDIIDDEKKDILRELGIYVRVEYDLDMELWKEFNFFDKE